jgi:toxin ParE1/3/4
LELRRSAFAEEDLIGIWLDIAQDNPRAADRMLDRIEVRCQRLPRHPHMGPARPDLAPDIRHIVIGAYLVFYRVQRSHIEILRVLHGRRDLRDIEGLGERRP